VQHPQRRPLLLLLQLLVDAPQGGDVCVEQGVYWTAHRRLLLLLLSSAPELVAAAAWQCVMSPGA
jgi:hypothetical protein